MEKQISHFKVFEEIGSGGMGVVYRARDQRLRRKVALKVLPAGALADPTIRERLMREAQTASSLNHPHIVTVFDIHSEGDRDFIAMEFVDGQPLDDVIGEHGLPLDKALRYALQIADGLACAHESGVIHRDLKPQNIMITPADDVKILDFGLAKRFLPAGGAGDSVIEMGLMTLTAPGVKVGTPAFMSPEQIESRTIDERSDIFSFGCLFYQMLTGVNPFQRRNAILIFKAVLSEQPEPILSLRPNLPTRLETILTRAMEKSPEDRYQKMRELLKDLEALRGEARSVVVAADPRQDGSGRANPWRLPLLSVLVPAVLAVAWWLPGRGLPQPADYRVLASSMSPQKQPIFSPAGDRIAFTDGDAAGGSRISLRSLAGGSSLTVTPGGLAAEHPAWSPQDPDSIIFSRRDGGIWSIGLEPGSEPRLLLEGASHPRVSGDGKRLVAEQSDRIVLAAVDGSDAAPVASIPPAFFGRWVARSPALSSDGGQIAYFQPEAGALGGLWVASTGGGEPQRLFDRVFRGGDPVWTPDDRWIIFSADFAGSSSEAGHRHQPNLWRVSAEGGEPERLTYGVGRHRAPALSAGDRRLAFSVTTESYALERLGHDSEVPVLPSSPYPIVRPAVSPSGDRIAFHAPDGSDVQIFLWTAETGSLVQVTTGAGESNVFPQWSADGSHLYYHQERPRVSLRKIPLASTEETVAGDGDASTVVLADWSRLRRFDTAVDPLGRRVVYMPIEQGEPRRLRVHEIETGQEKELGQILLRPDWSADGTEVLGSDVDDRIYLCPSAGGDCRFLAEGFAPRWGLSAGTISFARQMAGEPRDRRQKLAIWTLEVETLEGRRVAEVETVGSLDFGYGFLADGDLVWNRLLRGHEEVWVADWVSARRK